MNFDIRYVVYLETCCVATYNAKQVLPHIGLPFNVHQELHHVGHCTYSACLGFRPRRRCCDGSPLRRAAGLDARKGRNQRSFRVPAGNHAGSKPPSDISIAGASSDQKLAAIITPPAKPSIASSSLRLTSPVVNTAAAPNAVTPHVNKVANNA